MTNYMEKAFAPAEHVYKQAVLLDTWGHLAPTPRTKYPIKIIVACSEYGNERLIVKVETDLPDSPWFYDQLYDWANNLELYDGCIYEFNGYYMMYKNGNHRFSGDLVCQLGEEIEPNRFCRGCDTILNDNEDLICRSCE